MVVSAFFENILTGAKYQKIPLVEALRQMKSAGLESVYVGRDSLAEFGEELLALLKSLYLAVEGLHGWFDFGGDPENEDWKGFIDTAARWGAGHVLFVPGLVNTDDAAEKQMRCDNMVAVLKQAVAYGWERGVSVTMENLDQITAPYCSVSGLKWFFSQVDGLQCCYDTGNFIIYGEDEYLALDGFTDNLRAVHVKDRSKVKLHPMDDACLCADGSKMYPAPVGDGCMQIAPILKRLKALGYQGPLIAELYGCDPAYMLDGMLRSVAWLKAHR